MGRTSLAFLLFARGHTLVTLSFPYMAYARAFLLCSDWSTKVEFTRSGVALFLKQLFNRTYSNNCDIKTSRNGFDESLPLATFGQFTGASCKEHISASKTKINFAVLKKALNDTKLGFQDRHSSTR